MTYFPSEIVTPACTLCLISATDEALAAGVVEELELSWSCGVPSSLRQGRITVDGPLPPRIELEPVTAIVSLTRWTPTDAAAVVNADATYSVVSRDPHGTILSPVTVVRLASARCDQSAHSR